MTAQASTGSGKTSQSHGCMRDYAILVRIAATLCILSAACGSSSKPASGSGGGTGTGAVSGGTGGSGGSTVVACGASGQACCTGNVCNGGGCCIPMTPDGGGGAQRICVGAGQTCTGTGVTGTCSAGSCSNTVGAACGGANQACCGGTPAADGGVGGVGGFCTATGMRCTGGLCIACGTAGEACCQGGTNQCVSPLACLPGDGGTTCQACGGSGQPCCANDTCNTGLGCNNPTGANGAGTCDACGASGAACCAGGNCQTGSLCGGQVDGGGGTCQACGGAGQQCCPGATDCQTGLVVQHLRSRRRLLGLWCFGADLLREQQQRRRNMHRRGQSGARLRGQELCLGRARDVRTVWWQHPSLLCDRRWRRRRRGRGAGSLHVGGIGLPCHGDRQPVRRVRCQRSTLLRNRQQRHMHGRSRARLRGSERRHGHARNVRGMRRRHPSVLCDRRWRRRRRWRWGGLLRGHVRLPGYGDWQPVRRVWGCRSILLRDREQRHMQRGDTWLWRAQQSWGIAGHLQHVRSAEPALLRGRRRDRVSDGAHLHGHDVCGHAGRWRRRAGWGLTAAKLGARRICLVHRRGRIEG